MRKVIKQLQCCLSIFPQHVPAFLNKDSWELLVKELFEEHSSQIRNSLIQSAATTVYK